MVDFNIHLERYSISENNESAVFAPGDLIKGHVAFELVEPLHVVNMSMVIQGAGLFNWKESDGRPHSFEEIYVKELANIIENCDQPDSNLPKGKHIFPFQCTLPKNLPSTLMGGEHGDVYYFVKCLLQTIHYNISKQFSKSVTFIVLNRLPLDKSLMEPHTEKKKATFHLSVKERLRQYYNCIKVNFLLSRQCFCQGEVIHLSSSVINGSNKIIRQFDCFLEMIIEYKLKTGTLRSTKVISHAQEIIQIGHYEGHNWKKIMLHIPKYLSSSSSTKEFCAYVLYEVVFKASLVNEDAVILRVPIVIGSDLQNYQNVAQNSLPGREELTVQNYVREDLVIYENELSGQSQIQPSQVELIIDEDSSSTQQEQTLAEKEVKLDLV